MLTSNSPPATNRIGPGARKQSRENGDTQQHLAQPRQNPVMRPKPKKEAGFDKRQSEIR